MTDIKDTPIAHLLGQVYESAPPAERSRLLEHLLQPLSLLSLAAVANGIFADIRFRSAWPDVQVRLEDGQNVHVNDVIALVDYVLQVSVETVQAITRMLTASPMVAGSAAAALLVTVLIQCAQARRARDGEVDESPVTSA
ncbi:MAG: hypothetical protein Q7T07_06295 [Burkholderiaceae bacterium]|nr:hypothetical protein [Burkholderiaceae bacterium]